MLVTEMSVIDCCTRRGRLSFNLVTLSDNRDCYSHPPPLFRLGIGPARVRAVQSSAMARSQVFN